jgi:hypothetical protein
MDSTPTLEGSTSTLGMDDDDELDELVYTNIPGRTRISDAKRSLPSVQREGQSEAEKPVPTPRRSFLTRIRSTFSRKHTKAEVEKKAPKGEVESLEKSLKEMEEFLALLQRSPNRQSILQEQMAHALSNRNVTSLGSRDVESSKRNSCVNRAA